MTEKDYLPWSKPEITGAPPEFFVFDWPAVCHIEVDRIYERDNTTYCEIVIRCSVPGMEGHLIRTNFNLSSHNPRATLAKQLRMGDLIDWPIYLEFVCGHVLDTLRAGDEAKDVGMAEVERHGDVLKQLVYPFLIDNAPTIFYGEGSAGKSYLAVLMGMAALTPTLDIWYKLGLQPQPVSGVLYLDYEWDDDVVNERIQALRAGLGIEESIWFTYQGRSKAIADSVPEIRRLIVQKGIGLIIVDSLGAACGGNPNDPEVNLAMMRALRNLGRPSLLIDHIGKNTEDKQRAKGSFGSVYKFNLARSVWELRKSQTSGENEFNVSLIHRKANNSRLFKTQGFRFTFGEGYTNVQQVDVRRIPELAATASVGDRILGLVGRAPMWPRDIAEKLDVPEGSVRSSLKRLKDRKLLIEVEGQGYARPYTE